MYTYSATIALTDDDGTTHTLFSATVRDAVEGTGSDVFTLARGVGYDTETNTSEPVIVVQGTTTNLHQLTAVRDTLDVIARRMNQRAIGWFVSTDSYSEVK